MNARCYRCGWSFTLSRETIAAAVANANPEGEKFYVEACPRCKQAIKLPFDQLRRALPPDWKPEEAPAATADATAPAPAEAQASEAPTSAPAEPAPAHKEKPRHHHAAKKAD